MESVLVDMANTQGIWAALFIFLFMYQLRENKASRDESKLREDKLITFINEISKNFERLAAQYGRLTEDVDYIKVAVAKKTREDKE